MKKKNDDTTSNFIQSASHFHHELCQNEFTNHKEEFVKTFSKTLYLILLAFIQLFLFLLLII